MFYTKEHAFVAAIATLLARVLASRAASLANWSAELYSSFIARSVYSSLSKFRIRSSSFLLLSDWECNWMNSTSSVSLIPPAACRA